MIIIKKSPKTNTNTDYTAIKFGTINKDIIIGTKYGGIYIDNLAKSFLKATVNTDY